MVAHQLPLQQLEEEQAVHPHQAQGQGHFLQLGLQGVAVGGALGQRQVIEPVAGGELAQGVFEQGAGLPLGLGAAANAAQAALLVLLQPHQIQQLVVELLVEGVGVAPSRQGLLQQVSRVEEAVEGQQLGGLGGQAGAQVHVGHAQLAFQRGQLLAGNAFVEEVGIGGGLGPRLPVAKRLHQGLILPEQPVEVHGIEHVPLVAGRDDEAAKVVGLLVGAVLQVVEQQLLHGLAVEVVGGQHLAGVLGSLHLQHHRHRRVGRIAEVQHEVALVVHVAVARAALGKWGHGQQEVENVGFCVSLNLVRVEVLEHLGEVAAEFGELFWGWAQAAQVGSGRVGGQQAG